MKFMRYSLLAGLFMFLVGCNGPKLSIEEERVTGRPVCRTVNNVVASPEGITAWFDLTHYSPIKSTGKNASKIKGSIIHETAGKAYQFHNKIEIVFKIDFVDYKADFINTDNNCITKVNNNDIYVGGAVIPFRYTEDLTYRSYNFTIPTSIVEKITAAEIVQIQIRNTENDNKSDHRMEVIHTLKPENIKVITELYDKCINKN